MRLPLPHLLKRGEGRTPQRWAPITAPFRALGPGSVSSVLKVALDVAYVLLWLVTGLLLLLLIAAVFIPLDNVNITVSGDTGGRQLPLTRLLLLFGLGAATAYFGGFGQKPIQRQPAVVHRLNFHANGTKRSFYLIAGNSRIVCDQYG